MWRTEFITKGRGVGNIRELVEKVGGKCHKRLNHSIPFVFALRFVFVIDKRWEKLLSAMKTRSIVKRPLLIRRVPERVQSWIEKERKELLMTKQEFLVSVLEEATLTNQLRLSSRRLADIPVQSFPAPFTFVDLFAGIGGFRLGLERAGGRSLYSCEWDVHAQKTYKAWFGDIPKGDIREIDPKDIPDHDVMAAGLPCQPFSIAGVSKKKSLGRAHGFKDQTQGTLLFHIAKIAERKWPVSHPFPVRGVE